MVGVLSDVLVVDFSQGGAGPYCSQLLGDQGADVVKVEPPRGDWSRTLGAVGPGGAPSGTFASFNRNKRGVCLDLAQPDGVSVAQRLVARADVLVESFRPEVMNRWGLGYENVLAANPGLVYCSVSGFGQEGPLRGLPATDTVVQARSGLMAVVGDEDGDPLRLPNVPIDHLAGINAFAATLLGLMRRGSTGRGSHVGTSLLASAVAFQAPLLSEYLTTGVQPGRHGNRSPFLATSGVTRAEDGHLVLTVLEHQWEAFCEGLDEPALVHDPRFATGSERVRHRDEMWAWLDTRFAAEPVAHWVPLLRKAGVMVAPVSDYEQLVRDPQVVHEQLVTRDVTDTVPLVASPVHTGDAQASERRPPPRLGEHTREVLRQLGIDDGECARFVAVGAVRAE